MTSEKIIDPQLLKTLFLNQEARVPVVIMCDKPCKMIRSELSSIGIEISGELEDFNYLYATLSYQQVPTLTNIDGIEWIEGDETASHNNADAK